MPKRPSKKASKRAKKAPARKKRAKEPAKVEIIPAARVEIVPANPGDEMAPALELAGKIAREQLDILRRKQVEGRLTPKDLGHFNALAQSLTRIERSLRQWRELKKREAGELSEDELRELVPRALLGLGVPENLVAQVIAAIAAASGPVT